MESTQQKIWSLEETEKLHELRGVGTPLRKIAEILGRSFDSVDNKLRAKKKRQLVKETPQQVPQYQTHTPKRLSSYVLSAPYIKPKFYNQKSRVLSIGDFHAPYHHKQYFDFLSQVHREYKCNKVVLVGDFTDQHRHSRWPVESDALGAEEEYELALETLKILYHKFPDAHVVVGNHDDRYIKMATRNGLILEQVKSIPQLYEFPSGWHLTNRAEIDGVIYEHGEHYKSLRDVAFNSFHSLVFGHLHSEFGVQWVKRHNQPERFALGSGCGIDFSSLAYRYAKYMKNLPVLGCGIVIEGVEPLAVKMQ